MILTELPDNESKSRELPEIDEGSDDENLVTLVSPNSESDKDTEIDNYQNHEMDNS